MCCEWQRKNNCWSPVLELVFQNFQEHDIFALAEWILLNFVCACSVLLYTFIHAQNCMCNCDWMSVCEAFCFPLFMLAYVKLSICVHSATALFFHSVSLLLKLSVQFWIKAKQVTLTQTDGRPHAETRILSSHLSFTLICLCLPLSVFQVKWNFIYIAQNHSSFYPWISTGWLFTQGAFTLTILSETGGGSLNLEYLKM